MAGYERVLPGAADRTFGMAEKQQTHNHWMEKCGQLFGFAVAIVSLGLGGYLVASDKALWGVAACLSPIAYMVGQFVWRQRRANAGRRQSEVPLAAPPTR